MKIKSKKTLSLLLIAAALTGCELISAENKDVLLNMAQEIGQEIGLDFEDVSWFSGGTINEIIGNLITIKSDDKRSKVKEHFSQLSSGLQAIKSQLSSIEGNDAEIQSANGVIDNIITTIDKLASHVDGTLDVGAISNSTTKSSQLSDKTSVEGVINGIKEIVEIAEKSGVNIEKGNAGSAVAATDNASATAVLNGGQGGVKVEAGAKLVEEINKADEWAMLDKIKNATTSDKKGYYRNQNQHNFEYMDESDKDAGELVTGAVNVNKGIGAKTNADFAAAVALKSMSKKGTFGIPANGVGNNGDYAGKVKEATANAVNKVLRTVDVIIMRTLQNQLGKIKNNIEKKAK